MRHGDLYSCRLRQELCPFGGEPCTRVWEVALLITLGCCKNQKGQQNRPQTGCQWVARLSNTNGLLLLFGFSVLQFLGIGWGKAGWPSPIHRAVLCGQEAVVPSRSTLGPSEYLTSLWKPHGRGLKLWVRMRTSCSEQPQSQALKQQALAVSATGWRAGDAAWAGGLPNMLSAPRAWGAQLDYYGNAWACCPLPIPAGFPVVRNCFALTVE